MWCTYFSEPINIVDHYIDDRSTWNIETYKKLCHGRMGIGKTNSLRNTEGKRIFNAFALNYLEISKRNVELLQCHYFHLEYSKNIFS